MWHELIVLHVPPSVRIQLIVFYSRTSSVRVAYTNHGSPTSCHEFSTAAVAGTQCSVRAGTAQLNVCTSSVPFEQIRKLNSSPRVQYRHEGGIISTLGQPLNISHRTRCQSSHSKKEISHGVVDAIKIGSRRHSWWAASTLAKPVFSMAKVGIALLCPIKVIYHSLKLSFDRWRQRGNFKDEFFAQIHQPEHKHNQ